MELRSLRRQPLASIPVPPEMGQGAHLELAAVPGHGSGAPAAYMWLGMPRIWSGLSPSCTGHSCELGDGAAKLPTRSSQPCPSEPHTAALWPGWFFQRCIQGAQSDLKGREQARSWLHRGAVKAVPRTGAVAGHRSRPKENQAGCSQTWAVPHCPTPGAAETLQIFVCKLCGRAALPWHFLQLCFTPTDIEQPA